MSNLPEIDLSKVPIKCYLYMIRNPTNIGGIFDVLDKATDGKYQDLSMDELPALMGKLTKALKDNGDSITIAINSMLNHLGGKDE